MTTSLYLLETILILKKIRSDLHVTLETGICTELDEAIRNLEKLAEEGNEVDSKRKFAEALTIIGKVLDRFPVIVSLIDLFKD